MRPQLMGQTQETEPPQVEQATRVINSFVSSALQITILLGDRAANVRQPAFDLSGRATQLR